MPGQPPQPGQLRHRVAIQENRPVATNDLNEPVPHWITRCTRWAKVEPLSGREVWQAQQVDQDLSHSVYLRYIPWLTTAHRLLWLSPDFPKQPGLPACKILNLDSVQPADGRRFWTVCTAKEFVEGTR